MSMNDAVLFYTVPSTDNNVLLRQSHINNLKLMLNYQHACKQFGLVWYIANFMNEFSWHSAIAH